MNRPPIIAASLTAATTNVKVTLRKNVVALAWIKIGTSRGQQKGSREGRKRAKRRPIIPQMEGEEIQVVKTKALIL